MFTDDELDCFRACWPHRLDVSGVENGEAAANYTASAKHLDWGSASEIFSYGAKVLEGARLGGGAAG